MNSKFKWILVLCGLVVLIGGAYVAYDKLAPMMEEMKLRDEASAASEESSDSPVIEDSAVEDSVTEESVVEEATVEDSGDVLMAADFPLYDAEGNSVQFLDLIDKPTILNFWASTCGPCKSEMPHFQKAYETYGDEYNFIFVNYLGFYGETEEDALAYLADNGYTFATYFDHDQVGAYTYGIYSIPTTAFFSADGEFLGGVQGAMSEAALEYYIAEYFG